MDKSKFFTAVITIVVSVAILIVIFNLIFNNTNKVNQGNFRISDTLLTSIVELEDKAQNSDGWKFDITQSNKVSMLVKSNENANIKEVYLEKIKVKSENEVSIYIEQDKYDVNYKYEDIENKKINIYTEETDAGDYLIEFNINNEDVITDFNIPEDVKEVRHDGTILNIAQIAVSNIRFTIKYNLVIVEDKGQINTCKIKIEMPDSKIASDGLAVERLDISNFNFKVDY